MYTLQIVFSLNTIFFNHLFWTSTMKFRRRSSLPLRISWFVCSCCLDILSSCKMKTCHEFKWTNSCILETLLSFKVWTIACDVTHMTSHTWRVSWNGGGNVTFCRNERRTEYVQFSLSYSPLNDEFWILNFSSLSFEMFSSFSCSEIRWHKRWKAEQYIIQWISKTCALYDHGIFAKYSNS
jgi:hypothetical protein